MLRLRRLAFVLSLGFLAAPLRAAERPLEFVHALQEAGYGDTAVEYMQSLEQKSQVPPELKGVWDLEISQCYLVGARNAFNEKEAKEFSDKAAQHLAKFLKENPNHPDAAKAVLNAAIQAEQKGLELLRAAKLETNKEQAAKDLADAKPAFEDAKQKLQQALDRFKAKLAEFKDPPKNPKALKVYEQAVADVLDGQLQVALIDVYVARTIADPKDADRIKILRAASTEFDAIFQHNRENVLGLAAHMWQGKAEDELGNVDKALDIFEEVLSYGPDVAMATPATAVEPIFAEVEHAHLLLLQKKMKDPKLSTDAKEKKQVELLTEAREWLEAFSKNKKNIPLNYFQAIAFEYVKACDAAAEKAPGATKNTLRNDADKWLKIITHTRSDVQREAMLYSRNRGKSQGDASGPEQEPKNTDEALAFGKTKLEEGNFEDAVKLFETAPALAPKNIAAAQIAEIKASLNQARFNIARNFYNKEKYAECLDVAEKIAQDPAAGEVASVAASMSVQAAYGLYIKGIKAADKDAMEKALARLEKDADYALATWPGKPEADDTRMTVGQCELNQGKSDEAIKSFKSINIKSDKYPLGMYLAGRTYWYRYQDEKKKAESDRNNDQLTADRAAAVEYLAKSVEFQKKTYEAGKPFPKQLLDAQLLLGEVALEGNQVDQAVQMMQPLVDAYLAHKPEQFDVTVLRVFTSSVKAYSAKNDLAKAGEVGLKMIELGPDTPQINGVLMEFAKLLDLERKKAKAELVEKGVPAQKKFDDTRKMLGEILIKLKDRTQISPASQVFIADAFAEMDDDDNATKQYEILKAKIEASKDAPERLAAAEAEFKKIDGPTPEQTEAFQKKQEEIKREAETGQALAKAKTRIQSQLVGLKRKKGDFLGALADVRALIKDNPKALEPRLEEGRILQAQAKKTGDPKDFSEAVLGWSKLRKLLEGTKPRPPEYYEVLYNAADCLIMEAEKVKTKDKTDAAAKALQAEKMLNFVLITSPSLNGPDMVAQYNELAKRAAILQGRNPNDKKP